MLSNSSGSPSVPRAEAATYVSHRHNWWLLQKSFLIQQQLNPVKSIKHGVEMHLIDAVIDAQAKAYGNTLSANTLMLHPDHPLNGHFEKLQPEMASQALALGASQQQAEATQVNPLSTPAPAPDQGMAPRGR